MVGCEGHEKKKEISHLLGRLDRNRRQGTPVNLLSSFVDYYCNIRNGYRGVIVVGVIPAYAHQHQIYPSINHARLTHTPIQYPTGGVARIDQPVMAPASPPPLSLSPPSGLAGPGTPLLLSGGAKEPHHHHHHREEGEAAAAGEDPAANDNDGKSSRRRRRQQQQQQQQRRKRRRLWFGLGLGQVLSALIALTGVFSSLLARDGASRPSTQSALTYVLLSLYLLKRPSPRAPLQVPWWRYALLVSALAGWQPERL